MQLLVGLIAITYANVNENGYSLKNSEGCTKDDGSANRCSPDFHNIAYNMPVVASNTCGLNGPSTFYRQTTAMVRSRSSSRHLRFTCDDRSRTNGHGSRFLTDNNRNGPDTTWWQSETLFQSKINSPNNVTLILDLNKSYEITYIRLRFHSPRPESMIIEKRTCETCPWTKFQYYSKTCLETFNLAAGGYVRPENEREAICESKMSKITPISRGDVIFSSLEGRPSKTNFEKSPVLQEWVTATNIRITLVRMNTFGDEIFRGAKVLQSYYYAISDFAVGGRMKCNGHARDSLQDSDGNPICDCQHNTSGPDCGQCRPMYNNKPWSRATSYHAEHCEMCNCNGLADSCVYDLDLGFGRCIDCLDNSDGPNCDTCKKGYYKDDHGRCVPCGCNADGSQSEQCDGSGKCYCHYGVNGAKCDRCNENFYNLARGGCTPCNCHIEGSLNNKASCNPTTGECTCKENVHGAQCKECKVGFMGLVSNLGNSSPDRNNPSGCTACFCYGHSNSCSPAKNYVKASILSNFDNDDESWVDVDPFAVEYDHVLGCLKATELFEFPQKFLIDQRHSYNQYLKFQLKVKSPDRNGDFIAPAQLALVGVGITGIQTRVSCPLQKTQNDEYEVRLHETMFEPNVGAVPFVSVLNNLTSIQLTFPGDGQLDKVELETAVEGISGDEANWVEVCHEPKRTPSADACSPYYTFQSNSNNPYQACNGCQCNKHASQPCDIVTGKCKCEHNTCGHHCNVCCAGFYGNPFEGLRNDCLPCPCPAGSQCSMTTDVPDGVTDGRKVVCNQCPKGSQGPRCERCQDNFFGDPLGSRACTNCQCNDNTDMLSSGNCDPYTGKCLKCIHNTKGDHCEQCQDGFYGKPTAPSGEQAHGKGCTACACDEKGSISSVCDGNSGKCTCLPGVGGDKCDQCRPQHFNLQAGSGCELCSCDPIGSVSGECDVSTGQCVCKPGVTGPKCGQCLTDYWGHSPEGCTECNCNQHGSLSSQCNMGTGHCSCRAGVMGLRCDQCEENYFYHIEQYECTKCPDCYDIVQSNVNRHRNKLTDLDNLATEVVNNPHRFLNDKQFEDAVGALLQSTDNFQSDVLIVLSVFENFMDGLSDTNQTFAHVMLQLDAFKSQMETCERSISASKNQQLATKGTAKAIEMIFTEVARTLEDADTTLQDSQQMFKDQFQKHEKLRSLYSQAMGALDYHKTQSEKVQFAAKAALETSQRARNQITSSLTIVKEMTNSLEEFATQDLDTTRQRMVNLKNSAILAKKQALEAKDRVMALHIPTKADIPSIDTKTIMAMTSEIQSQADDLNLRLDRLQNELADSKAKYLDEASLAQHKYLAGRVILDKADRLMAEVHGAKQRAIDDKSKIGKLIKKAQHLVEVIKNYFSDVSTNPFPNEDLQGLTVEDLDQRADKAQNEVNALKPNVDEIAQVAKEVYDDSVDTATTATANLKQAKAVSNQTENLSNIISGEITIIEEMDQKEFVQKFQSKSDEVDNKLQESKQVKSMANTARDQVEDTIMNLQDIEVLLKDVKDKNYTEIVDYITSIFKNSALYGRIPSVEAAYNALKAEFDASKVAMGSKVVEMEQQLVADRARLAQNKKMESALAKEVDRLEQIHDSLPNWCRKARETAEFGVPSGSTSSIVEQT